MELWAPATQMVTLCSDVVQTRSLPLICGDLLNSISLLCGAHGIGQRTGICFIGAGGPC